VLGWLEYDDQGTPHLADCEERLPVLLHRLREAERVAHAEAEATRAMLRDDWLMG
jgi:hypothetical protein